MKSASVERTPAAGENIQVLRKVRGLTQAQLARAAHISVSLLRKIENGTRAATPPTVAAIAGALHVTTARINGQPFLGPSEQSDLLDDLRSALRRYTLPREDVPLQEQLDRDVRKAQALRAGSEYLELLRMLPTLLGQVTAAALSNPEDPGIWSRLTDVYGCSYTIAHRMMQPDMADTIVARQAWAARQTWNPEAEAIAAWTEAGTYQSAGQYADGLATIDRAITAFERSTLGRDRDPDAVLALGSLHLRGIVLASRDRNKGATEAHTVKARELAALVPAGYGDLVAHNLTFGPGNLAFYEIGSSIELDQPGRASEMAQPLMESPPKGLRASRVGRLCIDTARARLAINDLEGAENALRVAFRVAPQMTEIHPMAREVLRVLFILHQRSRPALLSMAKRSGLAPEL
ncbi:helix-turn-helix transcriptional regulator [Streptomyces morookaense]|uniref:helix-turn-helix domain-containing protein n=1 Tax=Streptomyces morookaense TaxID=1970 RepID=UPI00340157C3